VIRTGVIIFKMWVNYKKKKNVARKRVPRSGRALVTKAVKTNLRKTVQAVVKSMAEKKTQSLYASGKSIRGVTNAAFDANVLSCGFDAGGVVIPQGTSQGTRVGNKVMLSKMSLDIIAYPTGYSATTNINPAPQELRVVCFYEKVNPTTIPAPAASGDFFQWGGTSTGFQNNLTDQMRSPNTDIYKIAFDKSYKLGYAQAAGTGASPASENYANNEFKLNQKIHVDLTSAFPKVINWDDNSATANCHGMYFMIIPSIADNSGVGSTQVAAGFSYDLECVYQDM